ncbi:hypothetical protein TA3x_004679 [Tundrisphaera sp. TA3]|uniref:hypothetical protein n=1 Tax=Tundrisphaera sp. TA3 TaxID=3435775 RepID=UPI003EB761BA
MSLPGCDPRTLLYFLQPFEPTIPAPGPSLKGKKVVVLTHVNPGAGVDYQALDRELTREFIIALRKKTKKIDVVEPDRVNAWVEAHPTWTDPSEAAKAFEADYAILFDVSHFQTEDPRSPDLMEGTSNIHIQVWEMAYPKNTKGKELKDQEKEGSKVYEEQADTTFPVRGPVSRDTGVSPSSFRIKFLKLVGTELTWHFVDHAPGDDIQDVKFNPNQ